MVDTAFSLVIEEHWLFSLQPTLCSIYRIEKVFDDYNKGHSIPITNHNIVSGPQGLMDNYFRQIAKSTVNKGMDMKWLPSFKIHTKIRMSDSVYGFLYQSYCMGTSI